MIKQDFRHIFDAVDSVKLKKAGIGDFFDMLLLVPSHYEDRRLAESTNTAEARAYEVVVEGLRETPKFIAFRLFCHSLELSFEGLFFQKARYLKAQFPPQKKLIVYGRLSSGAFGFQMVHPKIISTTGSVVPVYKSLIRSDIYAKMLDRYVIRQSIEKTGLPIDVAGEIYKIHHPDEAFLNGLINGEFSTQTIRALKFAELFAFLVKFSTKRVHFPSNALPPKSMQEFVRLLPFEPTNSQKSAFADMADDCSKDIQARRIFIGDVGSGKTVVIAFGCFLAHPQKALVLAPTSILASQLATELARFLPKSYRVELFTQKNKPQESAINEADVLVGTHALLYANLPKFALLVVDEQHRFGSAQRSQIEKLASENGIRPHYFQFSATPIPRTQALVNSAIVDVSLMKDLPFTKNIMTKVVSKPDFAEILEQIKGETKQGRQVVIVYPLVAESEAIDYMSIEEGAPFWQGRFDGVFVTHGKDKNKDEILENFKNSGKILVATTLVEVGVSLPRLSTIVIVGAERLGLATLHQLRGRVSRNGLQGYCYLYTNNPQNERLSEFAVTVSGFDIAELDLKYRSAGDLLGGVEQSGKTFKWFSYADDEQIAFDVKTYFEKISIKSPLC